MSHFIYFVWHLYSRYQFLLMGIGFLILAGGILLSVLLFPEERVAALQFALLGIAFLLMAAPLVSMIPALGRWSQRYIFRNGLEAEAVVTAIHPTGISVSTLNEKDIPINKYEIAFNTSDGRHRHAFFYDPIHINNFFPDERDVGAISTGTKLKIRYLPSHSDNFVIVNEAILP